VKIFRFKHKGRLTVLVAFFLFLQCSIICLKSLNTSSEIKIDPVSGGIQISSAPNALKTILFFDERLAPGGFLYAYPNKSIISDIDTVSKNGILSVQMTLDATDYSGGAICLGNSVDLKAYRNNGALKFWIKGKQGGEKAWITLMDQSSSYREKAAVRLPLNRYTKITKEWQLVSIPLFHFSDRGVFWDANLRAEIPCDFDWNKVAEIRVEIKKDENQTFTVFLDDICIEPNIFDTTGIQQKISWCDHVESVYPPRSCIKNTNEIILSFFDGRLPENSFTYVYGGNTACVLQKNAMYSDRKILACYLDDNEYSAVTITTDQKNSIDLRDYRKTGGLVFWAKCGFKSASIHIGFLDHHKDRKVQSRVLMEQYGELTEDWKLFTIPLCHFSDIGLFWDEKLKQEIESPISWNLIHELRFSCVKRISESNDTVPVTIYLDNIYIVKNISDTSEFERYWNNFQSTEPELLLHDFQDSEKLHWITSKGPKGECSFELINAPADAPDDVSKCMSFSYSLLDWCDIFCTYDSIGFDPLKRDWTKHWGIRFHLYTDKEYQGVTIQITDSTNEIFVTNVGALRGWNDIILPFREFSKFIHLQSDNRIKNNFLYLNGVRRIAFKVSGNNTSGKFMIANVRLTNERDSRTKILSTGFEVQTN
jgi:hypothetical protein